VQDRVVLLELADLGLQLADLGRLIAGRALPLPTVDLVLHDQRRTDLGSHAVAAGDRLGRGAGGVAYSCTCSRIC
jgi:hypothetical protein